MVKPLSDDAAHALEKMIRWQGNHDYVTMELPAHDDLVIEADEDPFGNADASVDVALTHKQNGDVMHQPKIEFVRAGGDWFPVRYQSDAPMQTRYKVAEVDEGGKVVLVDSSSFKTGAGTSQYSGPQDAYGDLLEYANEWLPTIQVKYQNGEPAE